MAKDASERNRYARVAARPGRHGAQSAQDGGVLRGKAGKPRPHFKNHKVLPLADRQIDAGAIGIVCATLDEAEGVAHHGIRNILVANEISEDTKYFRNASALEQPASIS